MGFLCAGSLFFAISYNFMLRPITVELADGADGEVSGASSTKRSDANTSYSGDAQGFIRFTEEDPQLIGDIEIDSDESEDAVATLEELFSAEEVHDIRFITTIMGEMTEQLPSREQLIEYISAKGFTPTQERMGHVRSGFREVIRIEELDDEERMIKEFYGSYLESEGGDYYFDRLYYGLEPKELVFDHLVKEIDANVHGKYIRRIIKDNYARWDFSDGMFIFIHAEYSGERGEMVLIGKEWEIH